jgi:hypothetical protein
MSTNPWEAGRHRSLNVDIVPPACQGFMQRAHNKLRGIKADP